MTTRRRKDSARAAPCSRRLVSRLSHWSYIISLHHDLRSIEGVISGVSAGIAAWQEFSETDRKINRYTGAVLAIKDLMHWWNGMTAVDRNSLVNINKLVLTDEDIKMSEVNAWVDASRRAEACRRTTHRGHVRGRDRKSCLRLRTQSMIYCSTVMVLLSLRDGGCPKKYKTCTRSRRSATTQSTAHKEKPKPIHPISVIDMHHRQLSLTPTRFPCAVCRSQLGLRRQLRYATGHTVISRCCFLSL